MQKGCGTTAFALGEEKGEEDKEANISAALNFVTRGGELLKRTRKGIGSQKMVLYPKGSRVSNKITLTFPARELEVPLTTIQMLITGALHWKRVSFNISSNWQVSKGLQKSCNCYEQCQAMNRINFQV